MIRPSRETLLIYEDGEYQTEAMQFVCSELLTESRDFVESWESHGRVISCGSANLEFDWGFDVRV